jgi:hypothetical protein
MKMNLAGKICQIYVQAGSRSALEALLGIAGKGNESRRQREPLPVAFTAKVLDCVAEGLLVAEARAHGALVNTKWLIPWGSIAFTHVREASPKINEEKKS